jgi:hypothetical protein
MIQKRKSLKDISWDVDEPTYRADSSLSHSLLSAYARGGHKALRETYYEKKKLSTTALSFGSLLDTIITSPGEFDKLYLVSDLEVPSEKMKEVVDKLFTLYPAEPSLVTVSYEAILGAFDESFNNNWKPDTKVKDVIEKGNPYFKLLATKGDRTIVSKNDYLNALDCQEALCTNPYTCFIFANANPNVEVFYQLKFKISMDGEDPLAWQKELMEGNTYRVMLDIVLVDHERKTITPIDLKTTSKDEESFDQSIVEYRYDLQASSYQDVLWSILQTDEYYKNYELNPFYFVCVNRAHKKPVLWEFNHVPSNVDTLQYPGGTLYHCDWSKLYRDVKAEIATGDPDYSLKTITRGHRETKFSFTRQTKRIGV